MTTEQPIITNYDGESETFTPIAYEYKFTVEYTGNAGEAHEQRRVTFDGYATPELYAALTEAVARIEAIRRTMNPNS